MSKGYGILEMAVKGMAAVADPEIKLIDLECAEEAYASAGLTGGSTIFPFDGYGGVRVVLHAIPGYEFGRIGFSKRPCPTCGQ